MKNNPMLNAIRSSLGRLPGDPLVPPPPVLPSRKAGSLDSEIDRLITEINSISGNARRMTKEELEPALSELVRAEGIRKAVLWLTPELQSLGISERLRNLGVEIIHPEADKQTLALCDLGVTEADLALPETGTVVLFADSQRPRVVSLLPRIHLVLIDPARLRADLHQVFSEAKGKGYFVFVTGPSRTADIELTVTLGVHGPKSLYAWIISETG